MKVTNRRAWLALTGSSLLSACGGGGGGDSVSSATAVTLSGPSSGNVNVASTSFTVGANGPVGADIVVTPSSSGGGTFAPSTVTLTTAAPTATFTYTPTTAGAKTIAVTNNQGLANPASIAYTATTGSSTNPTFANVASAKGTNDVSQQRTATVTLRAGRLALLSVVSVVPGGPVVPTVAGWTLVVSHVVADLNRVSVFRRMATTDSTQSHLIDFGGQSQRFNIWSIDQSDANARTSGTNGSGAVVQVKTGGQTGVVQNCLLTFDAAFSSAANSTFAVFGASSSDATPTVGSGFTELSRNGVEQFGDRALFVEYKPAPDMTADMAWSRTYDIWTGVAVEVAAGP